MPEALGYAVYSEFENGYLAVASPSSYHWDPATAILYESPEKARASAKRRGAGYATAVVMMRYDDGSLGHEDIPPTMKAKPGSWIVRIDYPFSPTKSHFVTSLSRDGGKCGLSTEQHDARGFGYEQALELVDKLHGKQGANAKAEQVPANQMPVGANE